MLRRELSIALRSPLAWLQAALSALLVGHGFVLAVDLYAAASRSVGANVLMARELDPLFGVVAPTLGGLSVAISLLAPLVGARAIAIEKERRTWDSLLLQVGSPRPVLSAKLAAALAAGSLQLVAPLLLLGAWVALGGHLGAGETLVALLGHALQLGWIVAASFAAAAFARTFAQALAASLVVVIASWAIDASEGLAALAWLGAALRFSVSTQLAPFERGIVPLSGLVFFVGLSAAAFALAWASRRRAVALAGVALAGVALFGAGSSRAWDLTELTRLSLPPAAVRELRALEQPISVTVELDRDDARRQQLERDFLTRLRLARPDARVEFPPDGRPAIEGDRTEGYGRISVSAGAQSRETFSTSRRELTTLIFEAAGRPLPSWEQPDYPGYPLVVEGTRRTVVLLWAYLLVPGLLAAAGVLACRSPPRRRSR